MLPKNRRISTRMFSQIMAQGTKYHSAHFMMIVVPSSSELSKWAGSVSKKTAPTAVQRNKIRRIINGFFQNNRHILPHQYSGIVFAKSGMETMSFEESSNELYSLFKRLK